MGREPVVFVQVYVYAIVDWSRWLSPEMEGGCRNALCHRVVSVNAWEELWQEVHAGCRMRQSFPFYWEDSYGNIRI